MCFSAATYLTDRICCAEKLQVASCGNSSDGRRKVRHCFCLLNPRWCWMFQKKTTIFVGIILVKKRCCQRSRGMLAIWRREDVFSFWNIRRHLGFKRQKLCRTEQRAIYLPSVRNVTATGNLQLIYGTNSVCQKSCSRLTDCHRLLFLHKEKPILCDFLCSFILQQQNFENRQADC